MSDEGEGEGDLLDTVADTAESAADAVVASVPAELGKV